ncbi:hypothetical protein Ocin01_17576 [Orchesella cincta]|uniref:Uncharacterized protein n=1 Tax=Orchesella cincta TaxID=48709 RepID=A0A1D2M824_ORCCI|nr:hypothetical protein Ocin01_17576 [Orchesella cincta]
MIHPCCGFPLRNGAIVLSIIDIVGSVFGSISSIITLICVIVQKVGDSPLVEDGSAGTGTPSSPSHRNQGITKLLDESSSAVYSVLGFVTLTCIVELILSMILLRGAKTRDVSYCKVWWRTKLGIFLASTAVIVFAFVVSDDRLDFAVGGIFGIMYQCYGLWVVKAFILELEFPTDCEQKGIEKL